MTTAATLPVLPELDGQTLEDIQTSLEGKFVFEFLEESNHYTRYGIYYAPGVLVGLSDEDKADKNEHLPDAYVCNECSTIDSDVAEYGCPECGNGDEV